MTTVVDKVQKLLRLAQSSNPHEAANAAARAQELIDRHKLSATVLELQGAAPTAPEEPIVDFGRAGAPLEQGTSRERWAVSLASAVARANGCKLYLFGGTRLCLVGRPSDADTTRYLYGYLYSEIGRLAYRAGKGMGRVWLNNFRLGAVEEVSRRLREQKSATQQAMREEASHNPAALVLVNQAIATTQRRAESVDAWVKANMRLRSGGSYRGGRYDGSAREQGRQAGARISLSGSRAIGTSPRAIGG